MTKAVHSPRKSSATRFVLIQLEFETRSLRSERGPNGQQCSVDRESSHEAHRLGAFAHAEQSRFRQLARAVLPPSLHGAVHSLRDRVAHRQPEWEYVPEGWARARTDPRVTGWNVEPVLDRYRQLWPEWTRAIEGAGTLGADYTRSLRLGGADTQAVRTDLSWAHNAVMSYAYVLALMARDRDEISILDWGGGLGQYLPLSETLLPGVALEFHVKDVPVMCSLGRELNPRVHFHDDESWRERTYDLVFASSALQYAEDWRSTLGALAHAASRRLYISRLPTVSVSPSFVVLQRAESYGLETQFLGWFLNRTELAECARRAGLELVREFLMMDETPAHGAPEQAEYRGFLFRPA